jgi:hypothetical protein
MNGGQLIGFFAVIGALILFLSVTLGSLWMIVRLGEFRVRRAELDAALKRDMIARGMSVEEIERVLAAGPTKGASCSSGQPLVPETAEPKSCL